MAVDRQTNAWVLWSNDKMNTDAVNNMVYRIRSVVLSLSLYAVTACEPGSVSGNGTPSVDATSSQDSAVPVDMGSGVCSPSGSTCEVPPGTPLWNEPPHGTWPGMGDGDFYQPKFGGHGFIGDSTIRLDGYSAVVTWPAQPVRHHEPNHVIPWPGINLEGGWFIQNGYYSSTQPCVGEIWSWVFKPSNPDGSVDEAHFDITDTQTFCQGEPLQFKAEREGTSWIFSYRRVGQAGFTEHTRYDFGAEYRGVNPIMVLTEMYDFDDTADKMAPVTFTNVMGKANGQWKPVERMAFEIDFFSPWLMVRPDPRRVGLTTSAAGPKCYEIGETMFSSADPCFATEHRCDTNTGICNP
jgi:hypothetical protein